MNINSGGWVCFILPCLLAMTSVHAATIYKWSDADGNVHYGEQAPPEGAKQLRIHSRANDNQGDSVRADKKNIDHNLQRDKMIKAMQGDRLARQEKKQKIKQKQSKLKRQCARAKDTLRRYMHSSSLYKLDDDGNRQKLSDSIKQQRTQQLQTEIKKWCK